MLQKLIRPHILNLKPYSSARDEYKGKEGIFLDANENAIGSATDRLFNRYPDPYQNELKKHLAEFHALREEQIFVGGAGSDECIELIIRLFCEPKEDNILLLPPTYGMYEVSANVNNVPIKTANLKPDFQLDTAKILQTIDSHTKIIFICSPNNPTANLIHRESILEILEKFEGIVVLDEAYIDFADTPSWTTELDRFPNLIVLQTFSKAWGMAGLRLGKTFANPLIVNYLNKIKLPYNVSQIAQETVLEGLKNSKKQQNMVQEILAERQNLLEELGKLPLITHIFPTDANFVLVRTEKPQQVYEDLVKQKIIVRNRSKVSLCEGCLRITIGTRSENAALLEALRSF